MKRKRKITRDARVDKRQKTDAPLNAQPTWPLLRHYYPEVNTLRHYLVSKLSGSKKRQRKLLHYGRSNRVSPSTVHDQAVIRLLDEIVIGTAEKLESIDAESLEEDITIFTQQLSRSECTISPTQGSLSQAEIVDFAIWLLFKRHQGLHRPSHLLAHGFSKFAGGPNSGEHWGVVPGVPGLWSSGSNRHVEALKAHPWAAIPRLLGKGADAILSDLLLRCGVFESVSQSNNLSQMSGPPLCDLKPFPRLAKVHAEPERTSKRASAAAGIAKRSISDIRFIRHRMLYAKPGLNERAQPVGLGRAHVLSRDLDVDDEQQTVHVLKYIFPRQFDLHNVFTSCTDFRDTALGFKDYTIREQEIHRSECRWKQRKEILLGPPRACQRPLPKRLRNQVVPLVRQLRKRHLRCSYASLLNHYCPRPSGAAAERSIKAASSLAQVSAFCRAIVLKVFPGGFWGSCDVRVHNQQVICRNIDRFVRLRRYECLSLHDVLADIKVHGVEWPACEQVDQASQMSQTDFTKRRELMAELMYYLFDSFLIPLIRGHFYVTESSAHRNQLFYFRQDVWKAISEPTLGSLKTSMLEPCNASQVKRALAKRELGISQVRLLPKEAGMRPVINLRRRVQRVQHGRMVLGKSINSILTPAFSILNCEKAMDPGALASALFSVGDIYPRLQAFRGLLSQAGCLGQPLYFAKVDVKACFDTIPQKRLMQLAGSILKADAYNITKFARAKLVGGNSNEKTGPDAVPSWRFLTKATAADGTFDFVNVIESDTMEGRTRTVYVDGVVQKPELRKAVLNLLEEHIESNLITVEGRLYRQKRGIPQGSIISSLLCSYFYADLERGVLDFVNDGKSILLRLIDDFLVISVDQQVAERFMRVMHAGVAEYGVEVKAEKSRANFAVVIDGKQIATFPEQTDFQYCGVAINTVTLDLSKDRERRRKSNLADSFTVEHSKLPGLAFYRKTLNALKQQMQGMLLSTRYNSLRTVLANLEHGFTEIAQKTYHYIRSLPPTKQPAGRLVVRTVDDVIKLASTLMQNRKRSRNDGSDECCVRAAQTRWLACTAFHAVFTRRQTKHRYLLEWLEGQLREPGLLAAGRRVTSVVGATR